MKHRRFPFLQYALLAALCANATPALSQSRDPFREQRLKLVDDAIAAEGISNTRVLDAMREAPRHEFVPARLRSKAYIDSALPIGNQQTISPPFIVAYMTESIDPQPDDRVLEIGTGSGYQAAVLSPLVKEVYTIEIVEPLGKAAQQRLKRLGYHNVSVAIGDGYKGWPEKAPFDKIIVTCSPENVPQPLIDQLIDGGKMIIPIEQRYQQVFHLLEKREGKLVQTRLIPTLFVPMTGISEEQRKIKPDPNNPQIVNGGFELDENTDGRPDGWHYQRQTRIANQEAPEGKMFLTIENNVPGDLAQALQGMAVDGRRVQKLELTVWARFENATQGIQPWQKPGIVVHFYDEGRQNVGESPLGPWLGSDEWRSYSRTVEVPPKTREAIFQVGLNGGTGRLDVDEIQITPVKKGRR
jgi:protein-L-isoaspartate(D-aspartate) O-methyltransferase